MIIFQNTKVKSTIYSLGVFIHNQHIQQNKLAVPLNWQNKQKMLFFL